MSDTARHNQPGVVSFVRRSPRMNPNQQRILDRCASRYIIDLPSAEKETSLAEDARVDWQAEFGRPVGGPDAPFFVEIGSGTGDALLSSALAHPNACILGFEVYERALASTISKLSSAGITNVRLIMADAVEGLEQLIQPQTIDRLSVFFPDPWKKRRHRKRRLISPDFARLATSRLAASAEWWLATDWLDYAEQMRNVLDATPGLRAVHPERNGLAPRPNERPITKFERRGLEAGRQVMDLAYRRTE